MCIKPSNDKMEKIKIIYAHKLKSIIKDIEWYYLTLLNLKHNKNAMQIPIWHKEWSYSLSSLMFRPAMKITVPASRKSWPMCQWRHTMRHSFYPLHTKPCRSLGVPVSSLLSTDWFPWRAQKDFSCLSLAQIEEKVFIGSPVLTTSPKPPITEHHKV